MSSIFITPMALNQVMHHSPDTFPDPSPSPNLFQDEIPDPLLNKSRMICIHFFLKLNFV